MSEIFGSAINFNLSQQPRPALHVVSAIPQEQKMTDGPQESAVQTIEATIRRANGLDAQQRVLSTIVEISREIPENVNALSPAMAEQLAGRFLKGLELCGELYSMSISHELKMEILKRKEFSQAMLVRSAGVQGIKTAKEKEMYAFADEEYLEAANTHVEAKMFRVFVEEKKESFSKAHYLVRKIADRDQLVNDQMGSDRRDIDWFQTPNT